MMLAGFEQPTAGSIVLDGRRIDHLPPHRRDMGVVFQNYALFPHMTVGRERRLSAEDARRARGRDRRRGWRARWTWCSSADLASAPPAQLSGGQQQRVALARALVFEPRVVLMDEPLGALDKQLREQMQLEIRALHKRLGLTIVFVTHDQSEALTMSDRIAVFNRGRSNRSARRATSTITRARGSSRSSSAKPTCSKATVKGMRPGWDHDRTGVLQATDRFRGTHRDSCRRPRAVSRSPGTHPTRSPRWPCRTCAEQRCSTSVYQGDHLRVQLDEAGFGLVVSLDRRSAEWPAGADVVAAFRAAGLLGGRGMTGTGNAPATSACPPAGSCLSACSSSGRCSP